ncbi:unnamed protein product [Amoebophrya sp. A120]|nr:unnamed protein product [Amoebophrya sp. A120]|eukprot:GSA120T00026185001.1
MADRYSPMLPQIRASARDQKHLASGAIFLVVCPAAPVTTLQRFLIGHLH